MSYSVSLDDLKTIVNRSHIPPLLNKMGAEKICEIGVKEGSHFNQLISAKTLKKAVAIDVWAETGVRSQNDDRLTVSKLDQCYQNMLNLAKRDGRVQVIKDFSPGVASQFEDGFFDFVYIDADHTENAVYADLCAWWPKVRAGGVLAGHDYTEITLDCVDDKVTFGVIPAVNRFIAEHGLQLHVDQDLPWRDWFIPKPAEVQNV